MFTYYDDNRDGRMTEHGNRKNRIIIIRRIRLWGNLLCALCNAKT